MSLSHKHHNGNPFTFHLYNWTVSYCSSKRFNTHYFLSTELHRNTAQKEMCIYSWMSSSCSWQGNLFHTACEKIAIRKESRHAVSASMAEYVSKTCERTEMTLLPNKTFHLTAGFNTSSHAPDANTVYCIVTLSTTYLNKALRKIYITDTYVCLNAGKTSFNRQRTAAR